MASISPIISLHLIFSLLLCTYPVLSDHSPAHPPEIPPSQPPADDISPPPATPSSAPAPAPSFSSPPAPPPSDLPPAPSPDDKSPSPSPAPVADGGDFKRETEPNAADLEGKGESSGGLSSGQKVGVAIGVIAGVCIVGAGALVYKKRKQNIDRSQYGYAARREIL